MDNCIKKRILESINPENYLGIGSVYAGFKFDIDGTGEQVFVLRVKKELLSWEWGAQYKPVSVAPNARLEKFLDTLPIEPVPQTISGLHVGQMLAGIFDPVMTPHGVADEKISIHAYQPGKSLDAVQFELDKEHGANSRTRMMQWLMQRGTAISGLFDQVAAIGMASGKKPVFHDYNFGNILWNEATGCFALVDQVGYLDSRWVKKHFTQDDQAELCIDTLRNDILKHFFKDEIPQNMASLTEQEQDFVEFVDGYASEAKLHLQTMREAPPKIHFAAVHSNAVAIAGNSCSALVDELSRIQSDALIPQAVR